MSQNDEQVSRVPVTILAGFLGAGKTTLLKRILSDPQGVRFGVLVNDFGAINIDAELVVETGADQVSLANGCICCTIKDDLVEAAQRLLDNAPVPDHIIIETSGVSRPLAVVDALLDDALKDRIKLEAIYCLVDATGFLDLDFAATELAIDQAICADIILLNKCDVADEANIAAAESTLSGPMPNVRIVRTRFAEVPRDLLFGGGLTTDNERTFAQARERQKVAHPGHDHAHHDHDGDDHHHHDDHGSEYESWSWQSAAPLDRVKFRSMMQTFPVEILRAKGVLHFTDGKDRGVFHLVGRRVTLEDEALPAPAISQLVAIGRRGAFDPKQLERMCTACVSADSGAA